MKSYCTFLVCYYCDSQSILPDIPSFELNQLYCLAGKSQEGIYLAPLKRVTSESRVVTHNPIRPGTAFGGINTEAAEA